MENLIICCWSELHNTHTTTINKWKYSFFLSFWKTSYYPFRVGFSVFVTLRTYTSCLVINSRNNMPFWCTLFTDRENENVCHCDNKLKACHCFLANYFVFFGSGKIIGTEKWIATPNSHHSLRKMCIFISYIFFPSILFISSDCSIPTTYSF